mgnify:CR=1 FL=1
MDDTGMKDVINTSVVEILERMKTLSAEDRFQLFMEVGEWIFDEIDTDDVLTLPKELLNDGNR